MPRPKKVQNSVNCNVRHERVVVQAIDRIAKHRVINRSDVMRMAVKAYADKFDPSPER